LHSWLFFICVICWKLVVVSFAIFRKSASFQLDSWGLIQVLLLVFKSKPGVLMTLCLMLSFPDFQTRPYMRQWRFDMTTNSPLENSDHILIESVSGPCQNACGSAAAWHSSELAKTARASGVILVALMVGRANPNLGQEVWSQGGLNENGLEPRRLGP